MKQVRSSSSSFHRVACPHLGRADAREAPLGRPADAHRCFLFDAEGETISRRHQAQRCLSPDWTMCYKLEPGFVPKQAILAPAEPPPTASPTLSLAARRLLAHTAKQRALREVPEPGPAAPPAPARAMAPAGGQPAAPATDSPAPAPSGRWQTPFLWVTVSIPAMMLLLVLGLMGFVALSEEQAEARDVVAEVKRDDELSLRDLVAPTPVATFRPISELPDEVPLYGAPTLPPPDDIVAEEPDAEATAVVPGPWPAEPATGAPDRIWAPSVGIDATVVPVGSYVEEVDRQLIRFYHVAQYAAGWHDNSSLPGFRGNVVLAGHHNTAGKVFEHAVDLAPGDFVFLDQGGRTYPYMVVINEVFPETTVSDEQRNRNGRWIAQTDDERLTLVTCWPPNGNTHRVVIVAVPAR